jgi:hypothetical protein
MRRRWRLTVADTGSRMERQQAYTPDPGRDILSDEAHQYTDPVPGMQRKYAQNSVYNGSDALARLRGGEGG